MTEDSTQLAGWAQKINKLYESCKQTHLQITGNYTILKSINDPFGADISQNFQNDLRTPDSFQAVIYVETHAHLEIRKSTSFVYDQSRTFSTKH